MINSRISELERERLRGILQAEAIMFRGGHHIRWDAIKDEFTEMSLERFVREYCQEQLRAYFRRPNLLALLLRKNE